MVLNCVGLRSLFGAEAGMCVVEVLAPVWAFPYSNCFNCEPFDARSRIAFSSHLSSSAKVFIQSEGAWTRLKPPFMSRFSSKGFGRCIRCCSR